MDFSLAPTILGYIGKFPVTNSFWVTIFLSIILILIFSISAKKMKTTPSGMQIIIEDAICGGYEFLKQTTRSEKMTRRLFPFVITTLLLFLFGNLFSYLPGLPSVTFKGMPLYRTATTDYNLIFILSLSFMLVAQGTCIATSGIFGYIKKFITFKSPLAFVLGIMDIIGEMAKLISVSFRFFGNAFAGDVLVAVLMSIFPFLLPLPFAGLMLISAIVQPVVFAILVVTYISMAQGDE